VQMRVIPAGLGGQVPQRHAGLLTQPLQALGQLLAGRQALALLRLLRVRLSWGHRTPLRLGWKGLVDQRPPDAQTTGTDSYTLFTIGEFPQAEGHFTNLAPGIR
jgi:hypothetical protein